MKKLVFLIVIMMAATTTVQAEIKAGGSPAVDSVEIAAPDSRAGALPSLDVDKKIEDCACPPCCDKPTLPLAEEPAVPVQEPAAPVQEPTVPAQERVSMIVNIEFDTGKAAVDDRFQEDIEMLAKFLKNYPSEKVVIEGHTDNIGDENFNQKLSEKRAQNVRQALIDKFGIDGSRITAIGYGEENPLASNDTEEGRQQNRRVEAVVEVLRTK